MSSHIIRQLIAKDWYLSRRLIIGYTIGALVCLTLASLPMKETFYAAAILVLTLLIGLGMHLVCDSVIEERTTGAVRFLMSLPVTTSSYTTAKIASAVTAFLVPWSVVVAGTFAVVLGRPSVPDGLLPFFIVHLLELFTAFCVLLAAAILTGSIGWVSIFLVANNVFLNFLIAALARIPEVSEGMRSESISWPYPLAVAVAIEVIAIPVVLALTLGLQRSKQTLV